MGLFKRKDKVCLSIAKWSVYSYKDILSMKTELNLDKDQIVKIIDSLFGTNITLSQITKVLKQFEDE
jgi:hypothetical protein